jgi:hypothetical protein
MFDTVRQPCAGNTNCENGAPIGERSRPIDGPTTSGCLILSSGPRAKCTSAKRHGAALQALSFAPALDGLFVAGEHLPRGCLLFAAELGNRQSQKKPHQSAAVILPDRFVFCRGPSRTYGIRFYTGDMAIFGGGDSRLVGACMSHCQLSEMLVHN